MQIPIEISFFSSDSLNFLKQYISDCFINGTTIFNSNGSNDKNVDGVKEKTKNYLTPT
jgi:hypothetical protein